MAQINKLLTLASNASGAGAQTAQTWLGGKGMFTVEAGSWTGNAVLQTLTANGTWVTVVTPYGTMVSLTANGMSYFELAPGQIRLYLSGAATGVYAYAIGVQQ